MKDKKVIKRIYKVSIGHDYLLTGDAIFVHERYANEIEMERYRISPDDGELEYLCMRQGSLEPCWRRAINAMLIHGIKVKRKGEIIWGYEGDILKHMDTMTILTMINGELMARMFFNGKIMSHVIMRASEAMGYMERVGDVIANKDLIPPLAYSIPGLILDSPNVDKRDYYPRPQEDDVCSICKIGFNETDGYAIRHYASRDKYQGHECVDAEYVHTVCERMDYELMHEEEIHGCDYVIMHHTIHKMVSKYTDAENPFTDDVWGRICEIAQKKGYDKRNYASPNHTIIYM